jgi:valyl-tRNA synthetase
MGKIPFKDVYFTGIVRDKQGRKMSKSLGNSPDLLGLIDQYGADAVRFGIMIASPAGNDLLFDESTLEQGRNFNNKLWNATKLLKMWEARQNKEGSIPEDAQFAMDWFQAKLNATQNTVDELLKQFKLSEALKVLYALVWDDFCSWYLEWIKPGFEQPMHTAVYEKTVTFYDSLLQLLHPFMPFITEEIYQALETRADGESICTASYPIPQDFDSELLARTGLAFQLITEIRNLRASKGMSPKEALDLYITTSQQSLYDEMDGIISKLANISAIHINQEKPVSSAIITLKSDEIAIPIAGNIDPEKEKAALITDLEYTKGFLASVNKKLENEKFVANAKPEVLEKEQQKANDALARIAVLEQQLAAL